VVSPRGDVSEHGAARFFRRTGEGVYDMDDLARATAKMIGFVEAHVAAEAPSQVLGFGYSNGANILASAVFARPDLFDRVALMHPLIPFQPTIEGSLAGRPVLMTAGERDPICPPQLTQRLESWLKAADAAVSTLWHPGGHELRPSEVEAARSFFAQAAAERAAS
jgi:phospholipase/carboxylesterase